MPRTIHPDLLDCLRRPNPNVELRTEISAPDVGQTYRRKDQFEGAGRVSISPAASMVVSANGALQLAPTGIALANFPDTSGTTAFDLNREDPSRRYKGLSWLVDPTFARATLKTFTARIGRSGGIFSLIPTDFELHIHRVTKIPGVIQTSSPSGQVVGVAARTEYVFSDVISSPVLIKAASIVWVANRATLVFDLSQYGVVLDNSPSQAAHPNQVGELPNYYFVVRSVNAPNSTGLFFWCQDLVASPTIAGVGTFSKVFWARDSDTQQWSPNTTAPSNPPSSTITVESFATTSQAVYSINLGRAPNAGSIGRVVFERSLPSGTLATLEISTAGTGGPWTSVKHGDAPAVAQQNYHLRLTETSDTPNHRSSPGVSAFGIEYRSITDISVESILSLPTREIATPFLAASIPEASVKVLRIGSRDYLDVATSLGSLQSPPKLEAEIYLASRHPSITRDKWLRLEKMPVTDRNPSSSDEDFTLLSYASKLKRKIPGKVETINTVHTVQVGSDATKIIVSPNLLGPAPGDNTLYDGKHYYMRVQKTSGSGLPQGYTQEIQGNTGQAQIDFSPNLPAALTTGDTIEVHSGVFNTQSINWVDYDPADVWWEIMTLYANPPIPPERIGQGFLPRGGRPPHVTDRAPGDATTQAKLKVTMRLTEQESCDQLLDQVSLIMGGATVEIDGQICFVQVYPLRAADGTISVPLPPVAAVFDIRDYTGLSTPPGLEDRATVLSANYGVNKSAANPDSFPSKTTVVVDNDALSWLTQQDLEDVGSSQLPDNISRWLYNSPGSGGDEGLYLATTVGVQIVRAISTGKRVFNLQPIEVQPHLIPGDPVILITDAYTDYDPASGVAVKGWLAIRGVTVRVANQGRVLGIYILGLAENVTQVAGGAAGALTGLGGQPGPPTLNASFDSTGHLVIASAGDFATASQKIGYSGGVAPTEASVRATTAIPQQIIPAVVQPTVFAPGDTVYVGAFAYGANGLESTPMALISVVRQGSGAAATPRVEVGVQAESQTSITHRVTGTLGASGTGPLQYRYRYDLGGVTGTWSAWALFPSGGGTYADLVKAKNVFYTQELVAQVRDASAAPVESDFVYATILGRLEPFDPVGGRIQHAVPLDSGFTPFQYGSDTATGVVTTTTRTFVDPNTATQVDASGRIVGVYRFGVIEPVNNLVKVGDSLGSASATNLTLTSGGALSLFIQGSPTTNIGIQVGSSSVWGVHGAMYSSGYQFISYNAYAPTSGVDSWTQSLSSNPSGLFEVRDTGLAYYRAVAGKATGNKATFWGTALWNLDTSGNIHLIGQLRAGDQTGSNGVAGDIIAARSTTTGVIYFGNSANNYLYFDGTSYFFGATANRVVGNASINAGGQLRATGWWVSGDSVGIGGELGVSGGQVYLYSYNRTSGAYGVLNLGGSTINLTTGGSGANTVYIDDGSNTKRQVACIVISSSAPTTDTAPDGTLWVRT
jgi:hypothetical protein